MTQKIIGISLSISKSSPSHRLIVSKQDYPEKSNTKFNSVLNMH